MPKVNDIEVTAANAIKRATAIGMQTKPVFDPEFEAERVRQYERDAKKHDAELAELRKNQPPPPPTRSERMAYVLAGLENTVRREVRRGDADWTRKIEGIFAELQKLKSEHDDFLARAAASENPAEAFNAAILTTAGSWKKLGGFESDAEFIAWAKAHIPLRREREQYARDEHGVQLLHRGAKRAFDEFFVAVERIGYLTDRESEPGCAFETFEKQGKDI